ncbi:MAG: Fe-S cluster assembly ATPase SufC [Firmicutes bacterium]|nr:Fe-S cluster assembly ATPase SufC [Bacillota bacterium]
MDTLKISNLSVEVKNKIILDEFSLEIHSGEIHAIMGPNGTGKSTLTKVIMGDSSYKVTNGTIEFNRTELNGLTVDERARLGIFLGLQMPLEIEGVTNADFLRTALHIKEGSDFKLFPFIKKMDKYIEQLHMNPEMIHRGVNQGFSGGERKKNEILQMYLLEPKMVLLDEIDSGLDVDSLKLVGENVMEYYKQNNPGILVITHYQRLLNYIKPTHVHIMKNGRIVKSGGEELVKYVEEHGYEKLDKKEISGSCIVKEIVSHE